MNNANETRAEFNHLIAVAKDTSCAIVIIAHMNKMKDTNPLYRTNGCFDSMDFCVRHTLFINSLLRLYPLDKCFRCCLPSLQSGLNWS